MREMTQANIKESFAGESQAHLKYMVFAEQAEREGLTNVARLFRAASYSEQIHATNHLRVLGGVGKTSANLDGACEGENFEIAEMYPAYMAVAEAQGEKQALRSMHDALEAEKVHTQLYGRAIEAVGGSKDTELLDVFVCPACGFTMEGDAPERCPICGCVHTRFQKF